MSGDDTMDHERRIFLGDRRTAFPVSDAEVLAGWPQHAWMLDKLRTLPDVEPDHEQHRMRAPFVRKPSINPDGLGRVEPFWDGKATEDVRPGHILQPLRVGRHLSIDLIVDRGEIVDAAAVRAVYAGDPVGGRPAWWESVDLRDPAEPALPGAIPGLASLLAGYRGALNIETIGGHLIDVHPRASAQFLPIWGDAWIEALDVFYRGKPWPRPVAGTGRSYPCWGDRVVTVALDGSSGRAAVVSVVDEVGGGRMGWKPSNRTVAPDRERAGLAATPDDGGQAGGAGTPSFVSPCEICGAIDTSRLAHVGEGRLTYRCARHTDPSIQSPSAVDYGALQNVRRVEREAAEMTLAGLGRGKPPDGWLTRIAKGLGCDMDAPVRRMTPEDLTPGQRRDAERAMVDGAKATTASTGYIDVGAANRHELRRLREIIDLPEHVNGVPLAFIHDLAELCVEQGLDPATLAVGPCGPTAADPLGQRGKSIEVHAGWAQRRAVPSSQIRCHDKEIEQP